MDIATLTSTYLTTDPAPVDGGTVTPLIDTAEYHPKLFAAINALGKRGTVTATKQAGEFIYVAGWLLGLVGGSWVPPGSGSSATAGWGATGAKSYPSDVAGKTLLALLAAKAKLGVDVRVMGWCHFAVLNEPKAMRGGAASMAEINTLTLESIRQLRADPAIAGKAILNVIHHTGGAAHAKVVIVGNDTTATGFTGGIDFHVSRISGSTHPGGDFWHDAVAMVEGKAVQGLYDWYQLFWTENTKNGTADREAVTFKTTTGDVPHILPTTPPMFPRFFTTAVGKHHVQALRTLPARKYDTFAFTPDPLPVSWSEDGEFLLRDAWKKAISGAETYIYMEDQSFHSAEVLGWINAQVKAKPTLHVILVTSGEGDPNDPKTDEHAWLCQSIDGALLAGLGGPELTRIRIFRRWGDGEDWGTITLTNVKVVGATMTADTMLGDDIGKDDLVGHNFYVEQAGVPAEIVGHSGGAKGTKLSFVFKAPVSGTISDGPANLKRTQGLTVHTKTTLIDDHWAILGSANCMRRSLYTDCEQAVAWVDEDDKAIKEYRKALWAHHFSASPAAFDKIAEALHAWEPLWGTAGAAPPRPQRKPGYPGPEYIERMKSLTNCPATLSEKHQAYYDTFWDPDSRMSWGFMEPPESP